MSLGGKLLVGHVSRNHPSHDLAWGVNAAPYGLITDLVFNVLPSHHMSLMPISRGDQCTLNLPQAFDEDWITSYGNTPPGPNKVRNGWMIIVRNVAGGPVYVTPTNPSNINGATALTLTTGMSRIIWAAGGHYYTTP